MAGAFVDAVSLEYVAELPVYTITHSLRLPALACLSHYYEVGEELKSPSFGHPKTPGIRWRIVFYPSGIKTENKDHVAAFLELAECPEPRFRAMFNLELGGNRMGFQNHIFEGKGQTRGWPKFLSREKAATLEAVVINAKVEYRYGKLRLAKSPAEEQHSALAFLSDIADVFLDVRGRRLPAHRFVLASRSPVFDRVFGTKMGESAVAKEEGRAVVKLLCLPEDPDKAFVVARHFLAFLYSGKLHQSKAPGDSGDKLALLALAESYAVPGLKSLMEPALAEDLNGASFNRIARAAQLYNAKDLIAACRKYFNANLGNAEVDVAEWAVLEAGGKVTQPWTL